jgi:hypothetical protein
MDQWVNRWNPFKAFHHQDTKAGLAHARCPSGKCTSSIGMGRATHRTVRGRLLPSPCPMRNYCNSTAADLPAASPTFSARDSSIPVIEPQGGDLAQPRPTAWVTRPNPFQRVSPEGATHFNPTHIVRRNEPRTSVETSGSPPENLPPLQGLRL